MNKHGGSKFLSLFLILLFLLSTIDPALAFADHEQDPALITASVTAPRSQSASISTATSMEKTLVNAGADLFLSLWNLLPSLISLFSSLLSIISGDLGAITDLFTNLATAVVQPLSLLTSYLPPSITKDLLSLTLSIPSLIQEWTGPLTKSIRALSFIQSMLPINIQTALTGIATIIPSLIPAGLSGIFGFSINALTAALGGAAGFAGAAITSILSFSSYLLTIPTTIIGGIAGSLSSFILDIGTTLIGGAASLISAAGTGIISLTSLLGIPAIGTAITTAGSFILSLFLDLAEILGLTGGGGLLGGLTGGISLGAVATALSGGITAVAGQLAPLAGAVVVELVTQAGALITAVGGEIIGALVPLILQIPAALGLATGGTLTVVIEAVAGALVVLGQGIAILGTALVEVAGQLGTAAAALILEAGALGASLVTGVAGAITGAITGAAAGAAAGGLTGFASSLLTSLLTSLGLTVTGGGIGLTGGGLIGAAGSILSFILGSGITSLPVVGTLITYVLNFLGLTLAGGGIGLTGGGLIGAAGSIATKLLSLLMPLAGIGAGGAAGLIPNLMSMVAGILSSILGKFGLDSLAALLQKILTLAGPGISLISETLLSALPSLITDVALEVNDRAMDAIKEIFGLVSGPQGTLLGSPLLLRLLDFNPFTPYIPAITSLLPGELQFRIIIVVNQILDLSIHRFQFIEQFVLRTLVLITSQYTQILGLIFAPILACCTLPLIGLYRLILLPSTILEGSLNGLFAALFDAPLAFGSAISYWSSLLPRVLTLPLKILTSPLLFLRGWLASMFAPPPQNLFMIFLYPLLTIMKSISAAEDLLPASIIALCSPILVIILTILSPLLTPILTLMPYLLNVLRDLDSLFLQILQMLNGIPSLTNSFFVLRLISRCIPLPFTTTIGCLNTLYDLLHRAAALPMSLPCFVPLYQLFNLLIIPNGIINFCLSPCYIGIFTIGSIIKGIAEVLTIPELIQIAMLILTLPLLLISFILQIPSRIFNNMKMLCVSIIALDAEEPEVGEPLETQGRNNPADGAEKGDGTETGRIVGEATEHYSYLLDKVTVEDFINLFGDLFESLPEEEDQQRLAENLSKVSEALGITIPTADVITILAGIESGNKALGIIGMLPISLVMEHGETIIKLLREENITNIEREHLQTDLNAYGIELGVDALISVIGGSAAPIIALVIAGIDLGMGHFFDVGLFEWLGELIQEGDIAAVKQGYTDYKRLVRIRGEEEAEKYWEGRGEPEYLQLFKELYRLEGLIEEQMGADAAEYFIELIFTIVGSGRLSENADLLDREDIAMKDMIFLYTVLARLEVPEDDLLYDLTQLAPFYMDLFLLEYTIEKGIEKVNNMDPGQGIYLEGPGVYIYRAEIPVYKMTLQYNEFPIDPSKPDSITWQNSTIERTVVLRVDKNISKPYAEEKDGVIYVFTDSEDNIPSLEIGIEDYQISPNAEAWTIIADALPIEKLHEMQDRRKVIITDTPYPVSWTTTSYEDMKSQLMTTDNIKGVVDSLDTLIKDMIKEDKK